MVRINLSIDRISEQLSVRELRIKEAISAPFEIEIVALCPSPAIDIDAAHLSYASLSLLPGWSFVRDFGARTWTGFVQTIEQTRAETTGLSTYEIRLVPLLHLLTQNQDFRIYQRRTAPGIIGALLEKGGIEHEFRLASTRFPSFEYRVQFGESDFSFLSRICEEAGISYFFESQGSRGSVMILNDDPALAPLRPGNPIRFEDSPNEAAEEEYVTAMQLRREGAPADILLRDYDFRKPAFDTRAQARSKDGGPAASVRRHYIPGLFRVDTLHPPADGIASPISKTSGRNDPRAGQDIAERMHQADSVRSRIARFQTNALDLAPGSIIKIAGHPHPLLDPSKHSLLITRFSLDAKHDEEWRAKCEAVWTGQPYKPKHETPRPVVHGLQSAFVEGPEGQEIYTDEYGRIKVRFPWDYDDRAPELASCWLRVAQVATGAGFGIWSIPRIGQEVLISFLGGNPDEPIVIGQVPNALTPPPYVLPIHQSKTVIRTRSTPESDGYSEISFEDRKGEELFYERAERDKETHIRREARELVEGHRRRMVGGDEHIAVVGERRELIEGADHETIGGDKRVAVGGDFSGSTEGDTNLTVKGSLALDVGGDLFIRARGRIVMEGADATLRGGAAFFRASEGAAMATTFLQNAGAPGAAVPSDPDEPEGPILPTSYRAPMPKGVIRLPVLGWPGSLMPAAPVPDDVVICQFICECKDAADAQMENGERRGPQRCLSTKLRFFEQATRGVTHIWSEVPYNMHNSPPTPILSRNDPWRGTGRKPGGSRIPDIIIVKDPSKPPTQDNIEKIIEVKFPPDDWQEGQEKAYQRIAGSAPVEKWGPDYPCFCSDRKKVPEPVKVPDGAAEAAAVALLIVALLLDDAVGGFADDAAIPPLVLDLVRRLGPLFKTVLVTP